MQSDNVQIINNIYVQNSVITVLSTVTLIIIPLVKKISNSWSDILNITVSTPKEVHKKIFPRTKFVVYFISFTGEYVL